MLSARHGLRGKPKKLARNTSAPVNLFRLFLSPAFWGGASLSLVTISVQLPSDYVTDSDSDYRAGWCGSNSFPVRQLLFLNKMELSYLPLVADKLRFLMPVESFAYTTRLAHLICQHRDRSKVVGVMVFS